jgi:hypothetical protein
MSILQWREVWWQRQISCWQLNLQNLGAGLQILKIWMGKKYV